MGERLKAAATRRGVLYLVIVILSWGLTWPVNKALLAVLPVWWMLALRSAVATACSFLIVAGSGRMIWPPRADRPILLSIALLHMVGFASFAALGLSLVSTGRSVVLAYTTPLWVMPGAWIFLHERPSTGQILGVILGLAGLVVLFNPLTFDWRDRGAVLGNASLLLAALLWAANIVHVRGHRWQCTPFELIPWESLLATFILVVPACALAPFPATSWNPAVLLLLLFSGAVGVALPHWAIVMATRNLPAVTTSLGLLGTPLVSIGTATLTLGERPSLSLLLAVVLILGGIAIATLKGAKLR
jgi:drug/metabolite transporter (DMT)-like permease